MESSQRLKRGLKDLSPLFGKIAPAVTEKNTTATELDRPSLRCLSVYSAHLSSDSLLLSTFLSSKLANGKTPCFILTLDTSGRNVSTPRAAESFGPHVKRLTLTEGEWGAFQEGLTRVSEERSSAGASSHELVFFDLEYSKLSHFARLIPVLDQCILLLQPTLESFTECYRLIKSTQYFHHRLEYFVLYEGSQSGNGAEAVFERFSHVISKRLGVNLVWLGHVEWPRQGQPLHYHLNFQMLLEGSPRRQEPPCGKRALQDFIHRRFQRNGASLSSPSEFFSPDILESPKHFYQHWRLQRGEIQSLVELGAGLNFPAC